MTPQSETIDFERLPQTQSKPTILESNAYSAIRAQIKEKVGVAQVTHTT